jgi:hypothetical protein
MTDTQQTVMTAKFVDKKGNPGQVDGVPEWLVDNPNVLQLTPAADGMSCVALAVGPLGNATVTLKADADLGAGVTPIMGTVDFTIVGSASTTVSIDVATPTEQP